MAKRRSLSPREAVEQAQVQPSGSSSTEAAPAGRRERPSWRKKGKGLVYRKGAGERRTVVGPDRRRRGHREDDGHG